MKTRYSYALATLALTFAFATPVMAQDVAKEGEASATAKMEAHNEMMGEGCQCSCMKDMHEKMMKMHGEGEGMEGHAESEGHAEGMDSDEGHAEMMAAHKEMMAGCKCMSGEGDGEMSCKMHEGEGMQHQHGMDHGDSDEDMSDESR
ncbi:MAG: hypothetical protein M8861_12075 [marine benthic group bacterium]|nr:hypothetical protein [Gemmatimonadota bacterium]